MEFISAEEFFNKPLEVRNVFINWWKPSVGDLILNPWIEYGEDFSGPDRIRENITIIDRICDKKDFKEHLSEIDCIPGLTEGQLRQFIEDKTKGSVDIVLNEKGYCIIVYDKNDIYYELRNFITQEFNILKCYWKVACEIAKELVQNK